MPDNSSSIPPLEQRQPAPPLQTTPAPPAPPENPQNEEERRQVHRYEQWLLQQDGAINQQLKYYESEIGKLRKQRKVRIRQCYGQCGGAGTSCLVPEPVGRSGSTLDETEEILYVILFVRSNID